MAVNVWSSRMTDVYWSDNYTSTTATISDNTTTTEQSNITNDTNNQNPPFVPLTPIDILKQYAEYRWAISLGLYLYPVIIILGTIGNSLSFIVMMRQTMKHFSTCFYISVIAVADTLVLYFSGLLRWFGLVNGSEAMNVSPSACKILNFLTYFSFQYSAWLLVAMTIERFIAIHFPLKAAKFATVKRAKKVVVVLFFVFAIINCHFFWTVTLDGEFCKPTEDHYDFHDDIMPWIDAALYSVIPFIILFVFNILIIRANTKALKFRRSIRRQSHCTTEDKTHESIKLFHKLTVMLLAVSFTFLILTAPKVILFGVRFKFFNFRGPNIDFGRIALYYLVSRITDICVYITHAINFFLYCITGERFRKELKNLMLCKKAVVKRHSTFSSVLNEVTRYRHRPSSTSFTDINMSEINTDSNLVSMAPDADFDNHIQNGHVETVSYIVDNSESRADHITVLAIKPVLDTVAILSRREMDNSNENGHIQNANAMDKLPESEYSKIEI